MNIQRTLKKGVNSEIKTCIRLFAEPAKRFIIHRRQITEESLKCRVNIRRNLRSHHRKRKRAMIRALRVLLIGNTNILYLKSNYYFLINICLAANWTILHNYPYASGKTKSICIFSVKTTNFDRQ